MHRTSLARRWRARWMAVLAAAVLLAGGPQAGAQDGKPAAGATQDGQPAPRKPEKKIRGRLPAYYSRVVSQEQRTEIYSIQARFKEQMAELHKQLAALAAQRDKEVRGVLTPEQLVNGCLTLLGALDVDEETRAEVDRLLEQMGVSD